MRIMVHGDLIAYVPDLDIYCRPDTVNAFVELVTGERHSLEPVAVENYSDLLAEMYGYNKFDQQQGVWQMMRRSER